MKQLLFGLILLPTFIWANHCQELDLAITNNTGHVCTLTWAKIEHGSLNDNAQIPSVIPNQTETDSIIIKQTALNGPQIRMSYDCDGRSILIESDQGLCVMVEGAVHTQIEAADNMGAQASTQKGSFIWNKHGEVRWRLH